MYIADADHQVHVFTAEGNFVRMFGSSDNDTGQLKGIAASDGVVYIYSSSKSCVCVHSNWHSLGINIIVRSFEVQDFIGSAVCYH